MPMLFSKHENHMSPIQLRLNMGTQPHPSLRQNAYRDQCFVAQAIRIALPCRC
jgi:hypothetical protein